MELLHAGNSISTHPPVLEVYLFGYLSPLFVSKHLLGFWQAFETNPDLSNHATSVNVPLLVINDRD